MAKGSSALSGEVDTIVLIEAVEHHKVTVSVVDEAIGDTSLIAGHTDAGHHFREDAINLEQFLGGSCFKIETKDR